MTAEWYRCKGGVWCNLFKLDLNHKYLEDMWGVFIIWTGEEEARVLKVGAGDIQKELITIKRDIAIKAFSNHGLYVSWAEVSSLKRNGIQAYLFNKLNPIMQDRVSKTIPISINLPWESFED